MYFPKKTVKTIRSKYLIIYFVYKTKINNKFIIIDFLFCYSVCKLEVFNIARNVSNFKKLQILTDIIKDIRYNMSS